MKTVFVTGASGFIGLNVVKTFVSHQHHVIALVHKNIDHQLIELEKQQLISIVRGDIVDIENILNQIIIKDRMIISAIIHCAGHVSDIGRKKIFQLANFAPIKSIVKIVKDAHINKLVYISSTDIYGLSDFEGQNEEELPCSNNRKNYYPEFKIKAELFIKNNLSSDQYVLIRPAAVWGLGDKTLTPRIINFLKKSHFIVNFGKWKGKNRWPLANVKNVANAVFLSVTTHSIDGKAVNILDNESTSIEEFYRTLINIYYPQKSFKSINLPLWMGKVIGKSITLLSNLLNLKQPLIDPSEYALYSVASNLDFSNERFCLLMQEHNLPVFTYDQACHELIAEKNKD